jgi:hypothetical protein
MSQSQSPPNNESPLESIPDNGETIEKVQIGEPADGKRRVRRRYYRTITDADDIVYMETGDTLVRITDSEIFEDEIIAIGPSISRTDGMHILLDRNPKSPIHIGAIQRWVSKGNTIIYGRRESILTELEGIDYE